MNEEQQQIKANYKISFKESAKAVTAEVTVMNDNKEDALKEAKELFEEASKYANLKTLQKGEK